MTTGDADCVDVTWRPDGAELAFVSARHARADVDLVRDVYAIAPDGSGLRRVTALDGRLRASRPTAPTAGSTSPPSPTSGPDGRRLRGPPGRARAGSRTTARCARCSTRRGTTAATRRRPRCVVDGAVLVGVQREGAVELLRVPVDGGPAGDADRGPFTVRGVAAAAGVVVAVVAHDRSAGRADRPHAGPPAAADRLRRDAGRDRAGAPDARADGDRPRRLPGARLGDHAARARPAPGAADHPRRPVRAVRLDAVRRDPGLRVGRLRGRAVQSARVVGLRRGARAGDQGRLRRARRRRRARLPRRRADRPGAGRRPGRGDGRLVRRLPDHAPDRPHDAVRRGDQRAGVPRPGQLRGVLRHRVVLPRPVPRHRPRSGWPRRAR